MIISLSPLLYITNSLTSMLVMSFATQSPLVVPIRQPQTNFSVCSDQVFFHARSTAQWSALISIPF